MASFLDMEQEQRRMYVARLMNLDPRDPSQWPTKIIDRVIYAAERAADQTAVDMVGKLMSAAGR
jgi:hypothetical protein